MFRTLLSSLAAAAQIAATLAVLCIAAPAAAETLSTYYKVLIAVRKCELEVEETQLARLQEIIENRVTDTDASSETINAIFDQIASEIGTDTPAFCADYSSTALSIMQNL